MAADRLALARDAYRAFESQDRDLIESLLTEDFVFYSPPDPGIDRATYFDRCWPNADLIESYDFKRLEDGDDSDAQIELIQDWVKQGMMTASCFER